MKMIDHVLHEKEHVLMEHYDEKAALLPSTATHLLASSVNYKNEKQL
jgi:hypothetical protein